MSVDGDSANVCVFVITLSELNEVGFEEETLTVTLLLTKPPLLSQPKVYMVVLEGDTTTELDRDLLPLQPPDALHTKALDECHEIVEDCPSNIDAGLADREREGASPEEDSVAVSVETGSVMTFVSVVTEVETVSVSAVTDCSPESTETVILLESYFPSPKHVTSYDVVCSGLRVSWPEIGNGPLQPSEALQLSAFVDDQKSFVDPPGDMEEFATEIETEGPEEET